MNTSQIIARHEHCLALPIKKRSGIGKSSPLIFGWWTKAGTGMPVTQHYSVNQLYTYMDYSSTSTVSTQYETDSSR